MSKWIIKANTRTVDINGNADEISFCLLQIIDTIEKESDISVLELYENYKRGEYDEFL